MGVQTVSRAGVHTSAISTTSRTEQLCLGCSYPWWTTAWWATAWWATAWWAAWWTTGAAWCTAWCATGAWWTAWWATGAAWWAWWTGAAGRGPLANAVKGTWASASGWGAARTVVKKAATANAFMMLLCWRTVIE